LEENNGWLDRRRKGRHGEITEEPGQSCGNHRGLLGGLDRLIVEDGENGWGKIPEKN
jgi:hypothetical protein